MAAQNQGKRGSQGPIPTHDCGAMCPSDQIRSSDTPAQAFATRTLTISQSCVKHSYRRENKGQQEQLQTRSSVPIMPSTALTITPVHPPPVDR